MKSDSEAILKRPADNGVERYPGAGLPIKIQDRCARRASR
jgi:hypothetical protein